MIYDSGHTSEPKNVDQLGHLYSIMGKLFEIDSNGNQTLCSDAKNGANVHYKIHGPLEEEWQLIGGLYEKLNVVTYTLEKSDDDPYSQTVGAAKGLQLMMYDGQIRALELYYSDNHDANVLNTQDITNDQDKLDGYLAILNQSTFERVIQLPKNMSAVKRLLGKFGYNRYS